ncbi:MAG: hypothetical protein K2Z81_15145, partial [Cyanobacteria bacterium]|nr:hypothetical protein [Cyanobacteriota bacterium]
MNRPERTSIPVADLKEDETRARPRLVPVVDQKDAAIKKKQPAKINIEHSVHLRICAGIMSVFLIAGACTYLRVDVWITLLYIWIAILGTILSHVFRERRNFWCQLVAGLGAIVVIGFLFYDLYSQWLVHRLELLY